MFIKLYNPNFAFKTKSQLVLKVQSAKFRCLHQSHFKLHENKHLKELKALSDDIKSIEKSHIILKASETESNDSFRTNQLKKSSKKLNEHLDHGHSHSLNPLAHTHTHANNFSQESFYKDMLSVKTIKNSPAVKITVIGLMSNIGLATAKFAGGIMYNSYALIADAMHTLTDLISDFLTLFSCKLTMKHNSEHGLTSSLFMGPGKIDTMSSLAVYSINLIAGLSIGLDASMMIFGPIFPEALKTILHMHSHLGLVGVEAGVIALVSIFIKEWLFWKTSKVAAEVKSNVLLANAYHHRVDSLSAMVAMISIFSSFFLNFAYLDAIGGLIISAILVRSGVSGAWKACGELLDKKIPESNEQYQKVFSEINVLLDNLVSANNSGAAYKIRSLTILPNGAHYNCFMELNVPEDQKWNNILDIHEFESVREHVVFCLKESFPEINKIFIEFKEELKPTDYNFSSTEVQEKKQFDINAAKNHVEGAHICSDNHSHSHKH
ncbi:hypothetical protein QEN19_000346 [Hanseniaspora menglaensis]